MIEQLNQPQRHPWEQDGIYLLWWVDLIQTQDSREHLVLLDRARADVEAYAARDTFAGPDTPGLWRIDRWVFGESGDPSWQALLVQAFPEVNAAVAGMLDVPALPTPPRSAEWPFTWWYTRDGRVIERADGRPAQFPEAIELAGLRQLVQSEPTSEEHQIARAIADEVRDDVQFSIASHIATALAGIRRQLAAEPDR